MTIRELMEKRAKLIKESRDLLDTVETEERALDQEEQNRWDTLMDEVQDLTARIERRERLENLERGLETTTSPPSPPDPDQRGADQPVEIRATEEYRAAFAAYLRGGPQALRGEEIRALQADSDDLGGFLLVPVQLAQGIIKALDNDVFIRQYATKETLTEAASLGAPSLDTDPADPTWTSEILTGSEDSSMRIGRRDLNPQPLAKLIKVSRKLLRMAPDSESLVRDRLGYKFAVTEENAFQNGSGANEPLGVFVASDNGISTSRDASTGNTDTEMRFDGLIEAKYSIKGQYWPRLRWIFHRDGLKQVSKLKDGEGQYIWRESVRAGEPDRVLNFPSHMSEYAPNTFTTGLYVGILGDFSYYWIADALSMEIQAVFELYAATNQVGFFGRLECDGMPVLEEAFARVTLA